MDTIWGIIKQFYIDKKVRWQYQNMRLSMFTVVGGFPKLKGRAAELRGLAAPLLHTFSILMDEGNLQQRQMRLALKMLVRLEELLDEHPAYLNRWPQAASESFMESTVHFLACMTALGNFYHPQGVFLFHTTIKSHIMLRLAKMVKWMNPKKAWCYAGEDLMGRLRTLVQGSTAGSPPELVACKVMTKYIRALSQSVFSRGWREM